MMAGVVVAQMLLNKRRKQLMQIFDNGDAAVDSYLEEGVVCPSILRKRLFTTAAMDNIDHNPTSTTATTSFHGTSISFLGPNLRR